MDNRNLYNQNIHNPGGLFREPEIPNPLPPGKFPAFLTGLKSRKKLILIIISIIFLLCILIFLGFPAIKNRLFPNAPLPSILPGPDRQTLPASMKIQTAKSVFRVSDKISVSVIANSGTTAITAFDTLIEYDSQFLTLSKRSRPPLAQFDYYGKNDDKIISVSAVRKMDSNSQLKLDNTTLFELEFTPKKPGKTTLKIIYTPGATSESNLLDGSSKDVLGSVQGMEIRIK